MDVLADTCQDEESKFGNEVQFTYKLGNAKREEKHIDQKASPSTGGGKAKSDDSDDEPLFKRLKKMLPPTDKEINNYVINFLDNTDLDSTTINNVCENIYLRYPSLGDDKKYFIKRTVETQIIQKLLNKDESDDEPLSAKAKKLLPPSDEEIKKFVIGFLRKTDLHNINMESITESIHAKYQSFGYNTDLIKETMESYLKRYRPSEESFVHLPERSACTKEDKKVVETLELIQIGDSTNATLNYHDQNGFAYTNKNKKELNEHSIYLRCKNNVMHNCKASVIVRGNNFAEAILKKNHNHSSVKKNLDRVKFNKKLEQICRDSPFLTPRACYQRAKIQLKNEIDRKNIQSLKSFESLIYRNQKQDIPPLPKTIAQLEQLILDLKYGKKYSHDERGNVLFRGVWRGTTGDNVAFVSESTLQEVRKLRQLVLLMDGTFKVLPCHLKFRQLYIINVIIEERSYPLAFILMEKKDTASYELIFNEMKALISSKFTTIKCMSDYEAATRKALNKVYPEAEIYGCFFHYVQAITKKFRTYRLNKDDKFAQVMQKIAALALLPNDFIIEGFDSIAKKFKKSKTFARFEKYWRRQWPKANISVYGLKHRTNNFAESLNKTINLLIGNKHPHVWRLIHNLILVEMDRSDELERVIAGEMIKKRANKEMKRLNEKITNATKLFEKNQNVETFLKNITFNEDLKLFFKERIHLDGIDDEGFFDDDDDEEIIPNNFREESNFRKTFPRKCLKKNKK